MLVTHGGLQWKEGSLFQDSCQSSFSPDLQGLYSQHLRTTKWAKSLSALFQMESGTQRRGRSQGERKEPGSSGQDSKCAPSTPGSSGMGTGFPVGGT